MLTRSATLLGLAIAICAPASSVLHAQNGTPPTTLASSSYYGRAGFDEANDVVVDANGFVYVAGWSDSPTGNGFDGFVVKLSPDGSQVVYSTRIGGSGFEVATGIALDPNGGVWVVGTTTSSDFPVTASAFQTALHGDSDVWIAKLDDAGAVVYATYFGGSSFENGSAIAVGSTGTVYAAGNTGSPDLPLASGLQGTYAGGFSDAFVVRISGLVPNVATYFGGTGDDYVSRVVVDANGLAYLGGYTNSYDLPLALPMQNGFGGGSNDGFVTRMGADLSTMTLSTYLGGTDSDTVIGLAVDAFGAMYVTGSTWSFDFPTTSSYKPYHSGGLSDAFITKLQPQGNAAQYSTLFGADGYDVGVQVVVDAAGNAHISGETDSTTFPLVGAIQEPMWIDAFYAELSADGQTLLRSTPIGGSGFDVSRSMAMNAAGDAWIVGRTESTDFPIVNAFQPTLNGTADAFVSRLTFGSAPPPSNHDPIADAGADQVVYTNGCATNVILDGSRSSDPDGDTLQYTWSGPSGTSSGSTLTVSLLPGTTYTFTLTVSDGHGGVATDAVNVQVVDNVGPEIQSVTATPNVLTQANHQLVEVVVSVGLSGTCDAGSTCSIVNVTSNEPVNGLGDGDTSPDWFITGPLTVKLRAERGQKSPGRIYTITVECVDAAGNTSRRDVTVTVPGNTSREFAPSVSR